MGIELSLDQGRRRLVLQRGFGDVHDFGERGGVGRGDVRQNLAIELAFGRVEAFDKAAVGQTEFANGGVDAGLPEITEGALFAAAIAVGVLPAVVNGVETVPLRFRRR